MGYDDGLSGVLLEKRAGLGLVVKLKHGCKFVWRLAETVYRVDRYRVDRVTVTE